MSIAKQATVECKWYCAVKKAAVKVICISNIVDTLVLSIN